MEPPSERIFDELKHIHMVQFNYRDRYDPIVYVKYISSNVIVSMLTCYVQSMFNPNRSPLLARAEMANGTSSVWSNIAR